MRGTHTLKKRYLAALLLLPLAGGTWFLLRGEPLVDPFIANYQAHCSSCHGADLEGVTGQGPALVDTALVGGDSVAELSKSIARGAAAAGMPAFADRLSPEEIRGLGIYIAERRVDRLFTDFRIDAPVQIPQGVVSTQQHDFRVELVTEDLDPLPFSIAPLPDGRILVSEKQRGLRIVDTDGSVSELIQGTPDVFDDSIELVLVWGHGWLLDVAPHPDYADNGWIYLHHTQRCPDCWFPARSFNRVVRGRIRDGRWVDEQEIWFPGPQYYSIVPDIGAGGRLAFDDQGYLYISVGIKGHSNYDGVQDLGKPWGKVHRVHDDGRVPSDNPFVDRARAYPSTWTYGHRSPQGLEYNLRSGTLWSTEMGPRGGDELNLLRPGRNYGWPLYSLGLNYDGRPVDYGKWLDITFDRNDIEQPVVDFTPAPAVSSFVFYEGERFPRWRGNALVGSLKGVELYRIVLDQDNRLVRSEVLLRSLARIRDVETGPDGLVYLLLEHRDGGKIVRLVPVEPPAVAR
ncbi:MAG: glucose sorbosone dehydrogenase [Halioglobus sp.]|nr:glucose sorbosone dehydrogenase [Halioglobus sp.]|tara:strand:+ start:8299 stop:9840 length:1542 start_codon:yes stop_codon:yes gene_type:complete